MRFSNPSHTSLKGDTPSPGILQHWPTCAVRSPHSLARLDHMTASQNTTSRLELRVQRCGRRGNTEQVVACRARDSNEPLSSATVARRQGSMARLAPCGWQVGLPAIQLTASEYLNLDIGDDRVYTVWSGCRTKMTMWITAWWHVVQECVLSAVFTVNAGCWRLRPCYAYGRPDDAWVHRP